MSKREIYAELNGRADYQAWIDSGGALPFPGGECRASFARRCVAAFDALPARDLGDDWAIVAHGGTIMSAFSEFSADHPERDYYAWLPGNCGGYRTVVGFDAQGTPIFDQCIRFDELAFLADES